MYTGIRVDYNTAHHTGALDTCRVVSLWLCWHSGFPSISVSRLQFPVDGCCRTLHIVWQQRTTLDNALTATPIRKPAHRRWTANKIKGTTGVDCRLAGAGYIQRTWRRIAATPSLRHVYRLVVYMCHKPRLFCSYCKSMIGLLLLQLQL